MAEYHRDGTLSLSQEKEGAESMPKSKFVQTIGGKDAQRVTQQTVESSPKTSHQTSNQWFPKASDVDKKGDGND